MVGRWRAPRAGDPLLWDVQGANADILGEETWFSFYRKINSSNQDQITRTSMHPIITFVRTIKSKMAAF